MPFCPKCGAETNGGNFCSRCGASLNGEISASGSSAYTAQPSAYFPSVASDPAAYKLGWHKFLIYFFLWSHAVLGILDGVGGLELASEDSFFAVYGILGLAVGIYAIYVRFQLARFKVGAPKKLLIFYVLLFLSNLMTFLIDFTLETGDSSSAAILGVNIGFFVIAWRYYSSREALFIH